MTWLTTEFPKSVKVEVTLENLSQHGPTEAFVRACELIWPGYIYKPSLRSMELRLFDKASVEIVAVYRLPDIAKTLFSRTYRPKAVTLYMGRLKVK